MRCKNIKVKLSIPVPIDKPDGNGYTYSEDAIIKACENAINLPIIQVDNQGNDMVIGVAHDIQYVNGHIEVEGYVWYGGTCESIYKKGNESISHISLNAIGLSL